jgi:hypothetical protein
LSCEHSSETKPPGNAKQQLGFGSEITLLLTIASPFKYHSPGRTTFLDLVVPVIKQYSKTVLLAVGPELKGEWKAAHSQTNGRIIPLGTRWDNDLLYSAADVYLDSVPFSSITSLLEAGSYGTPLLGHRIPYADLSLLGPGAPGLDQTMQIATEPEGYRQLLGTLISDRNLREASGRKVQSAILCLHTGERWRDAVRVVYDKAENAGERGCLTADDNQFETSQLALALDRLYPKFDLRRLLWKYLKALPYRRRLSLTARLYRSRFPLAHLNLLPWPANVLLNSVGRYAAQRVRVILSLIDSIFRRPATQRKTTGTLQQNAVADSNRKNSHLI